jgi:DNA-binding transcriptional MerR regulator
LAKSLYYRIGQACKELDIQPYVLRYWETEFVALAPDKSKSGQRVYSAEDLQIIRRIKELLYDEGFTIAGAKKKLEAELESDGAPKAAAPAAAPKDAESEPAAADGEETQVEAPLDTASTEQIETLRQGVQEALDQSREILGLLDGKPTKKKKK